MSREYRDINPMKLRVSSIVLSLFGVVFAALRYTEIGLTIIFIAGLFSFGTFIYRRLAYLGAEKWAIGSIIVWLGFFLLTFPVFGYAWELMSDRTIITLFITGISLVFLGFLTEFFDLNLKLINLIKRTKVRLAVLYRRFKSRIFSSIWIFTMFFSSTILIISFFIPQILIPLDFLLPDSNYLDSRFVLVYVFSFALVIEIHEMILVVISSLVNGLSLLLQSLARRIRQLKGLIIRAYELFIDFSKNLYRAIRDFAVLIMENNYSLGFLFFIVFSLISYFKSSQIIFAFATLMLFSGFTTLLIQKPDFIADTISSIHHRTYMQTFKIRNRFVKTQSFECVNCSATISNTYPNCVECGYHLPTCSVCKKQILPGVEIMQCTSCTQSGHIDHLNRWLMIKAICPNCRVAW